MSFVARTFLAILALGVVMLIAKLAGAHIPWGVVIAPFVPFAAGVVLLLIGGVLVVGIEFSRDEKPRRPK